MTKTTPRNCESCGRLLQPLGKTTKKKVVVWKCARCDVPKKRNIYDLK